MLERLGSLSAARPRRTLLVLLAFVVLAAAVGGPVAGQLDSGGGFTTAASESSRADEQLDRASGQSSSPGVVLLVDDPERAPAAAYQLAAVPGVAAATPAGVSEDGRSALVTGLLADHADEQDVADAALSAFEGRPDVTVGGPAVADRQIGETVSEDLGRAEMFAAPLLLLLSIVFFRGRAAVLPLVVGVTTVLGTFLVLRGRRGASSDAELAGTRVIVLTTFELVLSPLTAKTHVARLFTKLGARDRAQLVVVACETGLVVPGERG